MENPALQKKSIRCGVWRRGHGYDHVDGYTTIPAWSRGKKPFNQLSPMILGPILLIEPLPLRPGFQMSADGKETVMECPLFENYWQGNKIYNCDLIDPAKGLTVENLTDAFWERRAKVLSSTEPVRRSLPKAKYGVPIASYYKGEILGYVAARKLFYCPWYAYMVTCHPVFVELQKRYDAGEKLLIVGPDGYDKDVDLNRDVLAWLIEDTSRPFGHELVICGMLMGINY